MRFLRKILSFFRRGERVQTPGSNYAKAYNQEWDKIIEEKIVYHNLLSLVETHCVDIHKLQDNFTNLSFNTRVLVLREFFKAMMYFESAYNPESACVDVGNKKNKDTWSVGLFQVSVCDQENYKLPTSYTYQDLLDPENNIDLAFRIFARQLLRTKKIFIPKGEAGVYWAVIHPGGKYDKTQSIINLTREALKKQNQFLR